MRILGWLVLGAFGLAAAVWLLGREPPAPGAPASSAAGLAAPPEAAGGGPTLQGQPPPAAAARAAPAAQDAPRGWVRVEGLVIDERRRPIAGALVALRCAGATVAEVRTEEHGLYRLEHALELPAAESSAGVRAASGLSLVLHATAPDGRVGLRHAFLAPQGVEEVWRVDPIQVRASHAATVVVRAAGVPLAGARIRWLHRGTERGPQARWVATGRSDERGTWVAPALPAGTSSAWVDAAGYALTVATTILPRVAPEPLAVDLAPVRTLRVRVVETGTRGPVAGAQVELTVWPRQPAVVDPGIATFLAGQTDAAGHCLVARPASGLPVYARAFAADRPRRWMANRDNVEVNEDVEEVVLEMLAATVLRWLIEPGEGDLPPDGSTVRILDARDSFEPEGYAVPVQGLVQDGHLVVRNAVPSANVALALLALLPDGRAAHATVPQGEQEGPPVRFVTPRRIQVRVRDADGTPRAGVGVTTSGQPQELRKAVRAFTDPRGACTIQPLLPVTTSVRIYGRFQTLDRLQQSVDLAAGDGEVEFVLPPPRRLRVRVRIDGRPELPAAWTVVLGLHTYVDESLVLEDPTSGEFLVNIHTEQDLDGLPARLEVPGLPPAFETIRAEGQECGVTFALSTGGALRVHVQPPPDGRYDLALERFFEEAEGWRACAPPAAPQAVEEHVWRFGPLPAGRWRVRDRLTGIVSDGVELDPARGEHALAFDLGAVFEAQGRVAAPAGTAWTWVRVVCGGCPTEDPHAPRVQLIGPGTPRPAPFEEPPAGRPVQGDGTFTVRVDGRDPVELRAWHPLLRAGDAVTVTGPVDDLVLRLVEAPTVHVVFAAPDEAAPRPAPGARRAVLLRDGEEVFTARPVRELGGVRFGGFVAGTYDLWIDGGALAPLRLGRVELGAGETRIPDARFPTGATVRVEVRRKAGLPERPVYVRAEHLGVPGYARATIIRPVGGSRLSGLGPGRFSLVVREVMGSTTVLDERTIESDGRSEQTVLVEVP